MNTARSVVPGGIADTSGSATGAICASTISRACSAAPSPNGDVALDAGQPRAVVGDVEQPRLDLAARRSPRRAGFTGAGAVDRGRVPAGQADEQHPATAATATTSAPMARPRRCVIGRRARFRRGAHRAVAELDDRVEQRPARTRSGTRRPRAASPAPGWSGSPSRPAPPACSPTRARAAARDSTGRFASGTRFVELRFEQLRRTPSTRSTCARLREVPRHQLDVARAAAEGRHPLGRERRARRVAGIAARTRRSRSTRPQVAGRSEALACRLMNRSALLLLAIAVRSSIGTLRSSSRVSRTRMPSRASIAPLTRRATASVRSFSFVPSGALRAFVVAAVAGIDGDGANRRPAGRRAAAGPAAAGGSRRRTAAGGIGLRRGRQIDHQPRVVSIGWFDAGSRRSAARDRRERRRVRLADRLNHALRGALSRERQTRVGDVERVGVELDREVLGVLRHDVAGARGVASIVSRRGGAERVRSARDARHAQIADDEQVRRLAQIEPRVVDQRERAADELDRHQPPAAGARTGGAGSETSRPATDASAWSGVRTMVFPL